jgi:hypothetical protein
MSGQIHSSAEHVTQWRVEDIQCWWEWGNPRDGLDFLYFGWSGTQSTITEATSDLLYQPWMLMSVEQTVEWLTRETDARGENLPQCRFVHHKSHMSWSGLELGPPRWDGLELHQLLRTSSKALYCVFLGYFFTGFKTLLICYRNVVCT